MEQSLVKEILESRVFHENVENQTFCMIGKSWKVFFFVKIVDGGLLSKNKFKKKKFNQRLQLIKLNEKCGMDGEKFANNLS